MIKTLPWARDIIGSKVHALHVTNPSSIADTKWYPEHHKM